MAREIDFSTGTIVSADWLDAQQEADSASAFGIRLVRSSNTTISIPPAVDGSPLGQASVRINGLPRWNSAAISLNFASPPLASGTYSIYVVAGAGPDFTMSATTGAAPANSRKVGEVVWDGATITAIRGMVDAVSTHNHLHRPGGDDAIDYTLVNLRSTLGSRPAAAPTNAGLLHLASDTGMLSRSTGVAWEDVMPSQAIQDFTIGRQLIMPTQGNTGGLVLGGDVNLYRSGVEILKTDDYLHVGLDLGARMGAAQQMVLGTVGGFPGLLFGNGLDTNLYRSAANTLKTDDSFIVAGDLTVQGAIIGSVSGTTGNTLSLAGTGKTTLTFQDATTTTGLTIGADTNLYRSGADLLKTDDNFEAVGSVQGAHLYASNVNGRVYFGGGTWDTSVYRSAADTLKTDDAFQAASYAVGTTPLAALHLSNGTTGTGAIVLASAPTIAGAANFTGTPTFAATGMTIGGDTNLYRSAASILKTDDAFQAASYAVGTTPLAASHLSNGTTGTGSVMLSVSPTTTGTLTAAAIALSGTLTIGGDANLYRSAANVLKTDDAFQAASYAVGTTPLAASHLSNGTTGTGAVVLAAAPTLSGTVTFSGTPAFATTGMTIGGDVNLYRGAANQLKSDDALVLVGAFSTDSTASVGSFLSANTATPANTVFVGATASGVFGPGLAFGSAADVNIYRSAANILKTDDNFQAGVAITAQAGQAGAVTIGTSSVTPTIALGSRVIYNDGSNGVRTDSHYYANGNVYAQGSGGGTVSIGRVGPGVTYGIRLDDDGCILYRAGDDVTTCSGEFRAARFVAADGGDTIIRDASGQDLTFAFDGAQFVIFRNGAEFKRF